jgi:hypothetical protein
MLAHVAGPSGASGALPCATRHASQPGTGSVQALLALLGETEARLLHPDAWPCLLANLERLEVSCPAECSRRTVQMWSSWVIWIE